MAEKRKISVLVPHKLKQATVRLTDAEFRELVLAIIDYDEKNIEPNLSPRVEGHFENMRPDIDENKYAYITSCKKQSERAKKRWPKDLTAPPEADAPPGDLPPAEEPLLDGIEGIGEECHGIPPHTTDAHIDVDVVLDTDSVLDNNTLVQTGQGEPAFSPEELISKCWEKFYSTYPRHEDKKDAQTAYFMVFKGFKGSDQIIKQAHVILSGLNSAVANWERKGTEKRYIPLPSTWLKGERWNDDLKGTDPPQQLCQGGGSKTSSAGFYEGLAKAVKDGVQ